MSITQEQFDALKPGDRVQVGPTWAEADFIGHLRGFAWVLLDGELVAQGYAPVGIAAIIRPAPQPVAYVNLHMDRTGAQVVGAAYGTRAKADELGALYGRTHIALIHDDGTITTEAVS